ncbi:hypothetical protein DsansV1_C16g0142791 [Dioscorea sansibarensis]
MVMVIYIGMKITKWNPGQHQPVLGGEAGEESRAVGVESIGDEVCGEGADEDGGGGDGDGHGRTKDATLYISWLSIFKRKHISIYKRSMFLLL